MGIIFKIENRMADVYDKEAMGTPLNDGQVNDSENLDELKVDGEEEDKPSIRNGKLRWLMLVFGCFFLMGSYFCFDIPASLGPYFKKPPYNYGSKQIALMYSVYSFPNTVLPLVGGVLIDKIGVKISLVGFTTILTIG